MPNRRNGDFLPRKVDLILVSETFGRTDPFSFEPKFPEILVEWITPLTSSKVKKRLVLGASQFKSYLRISKT